jgi:hypothetical protein
VKKVRLVGNGRTQYHAGVTYSPTPSREELLVLLHIIGMLDWQYVHIDEKRAFLNAKHAGDNSVFAKFRGESQIYRVNNALYGLKTSPRDYNNEVATRLEGMGFKRLHLCSCMFVKRSESGAVVIIYDYVDDFVVTGSDTGVLNEFVSEFRDKVTTTEPIWNASMILGMELSRIREKRVILVRMAGKIEELAELHKVTEGRVKRVPMPQHGYIIDDYEYENMREEFGRFLDKAEVTEYLKLVGSLLWLTGVRLDIIFSVMYLTWFTKKPRVHHLNMAVYTVNYLYNTRDVPLVLGGRGQLKLIAYTDSSLGTGPQSRSVSGQFVRLGENAGGVFAKSTASHTVRLSSFESELDAASSAIKTVSKLMNRIREIGFELKDTPILYSDNEAMIQFVHGEGVAKGVRHMELRMWYTREQYKKGEVKLEFMPGAQITADKFTKLGTKEEVSQFMYDVQGLKLLEDEKE